jgi:hypothetical protein
LFEGIICEPKDPKWPPSATAIDYEISHQEPDKPVKNGPNATHGSDQALKETVSPHPKEPTGTNEVNCARGKTTMEDQQSSNPFINGAEAPSSSTQKDADWREILKRLLNEFSDSLAQGKIRSTQDNVLKHPQDLGTIIEAIENGVQFRVKHLIS